jgi:hypothetical protein
MCSLWLHARAEKCLKTVSKPSIMVKQHIFNINSQSLLVEIIFIERGNLLPRLLLLYMLLCAVLTKPVRSSPDCDDGLGQRCANKRCKTYSNQKCIYALFSATASARDLCLRVNIYIQNNNMLSTARRQNTSCSARYTLPFQPLM